MRHIFFAYAFITLLLFSVLSVLSYGYGMGYVYVYWRDWQIQTNLWLLFFVLACLSLVLQLMWYIGRRYFSRSKRQLETVFDFKNLHPYEQLAVIWLLDAAQEQQQFIQQVFQQSHLLEGVMNARLAVLQGDNEKALNTLNKIHTMAFELAELQRIEVYLLQNDANQALTHLEFLNQHALSPWLMAVEDAYQQRLVVLWGKFALQFPWEYLRATQYGHLASNTKEQWLAQILLHFDQATDDDLKHLKQRYLDLIPDLAEKTTVVKMLWLKVLSRFHDLYAEQQTLATSLLNESFHEDVFYLWFEQQWLQTPIDYAEIEQKINQWEQQYLNLPVLTFAKYYVYQATDRHIEAEKLLSLYPEHILMSYLRIKQALMNQPELVLQLKYLMSSHVNDIGIKI